MQPLFTMQFLINSTTAKVESGEMTREQQAEILGSAYRVARQGVEDADRSIKRWGVAGVLVMGAYILGLTYWPNIRDVLETIGVLG